MSDATCKTCPWFDVECGACRADPPVRSSTGKGFWPIVSPGNWCARHPERATSAPTGTTLLDVWREAFNRWAEIRHPDALRLAAEAVESARLATEGAQ